MFPESGTYVPCPLMSVGSMSDHEDVSVVFVLDCFPRSEKLFQWSKHLYKKIPCKDIFVKINLLTGFFVDPTFAFRTALNLCDINSVMCCKHSSEISVHIDTTASHS